MARTFEAKIYWLSEAQGGRKDLPFGNQYAPIIKLSHAKETPEGEWSIVVINQEQLSKQETISKMRYLSENAPDNLKCGMEFSLFEGRKLVAQGVILKEISVTNPRGIECVFAKLARVWEFFDFSELPFDSHYFHVVDAFVFSDGKKIKVPGQFKAEYFRELIQHSFCAEGLVVHLYPEGVSPEEIDTYQDFLQSGCEMIILIYDSCYVEVYCKREEWLRLMLKKARGIEGTVVEEKYEHTDVRTEMYV